MSNKKEENLTSTEKFAGKIETWLGKNSKLLTIIIAVLVVVVVALVVILSVSDSKDDKKYSALYAIEKQSDSLIIMDPASDEYKNARSALESDADSLIASSSIKKYPAAKATLILADIAYDNAEYEKALELYSSVVENQKKNSYMVQVATMNAAACNEALNNNSEALALYNKLWDDYGHDGIYASRALFNVARLYEKLGNIDLAKATYDQLAGEFSDANSEYSKLATSRSAQLSR